MYSQDGTGNSWMSLWTYLLHKSAICDWIHWGKVCILTLQNTQVGKKKKIKLQIQTLQAASLKYNYQPATISSWKGQDEEVGITPRSKITTATGKQYQHLLNPAWAFFLVRLHRPQRVLTSYTRPPAADGPSLCLCSRQGSRSAWRFIDARSPLSQDLPPITAAGKQRGGSCRDERVCLCVCSSSGSKAINPVPKCQVTCQHASLCHPSFKSDKGPFSALKWWFLEWGNDDLSYMEKGLAILHRQEGDKGKMDC